MNTKLCIGATGAALLMAGLASAQTYTEILTFFPNRMSADGSTLVGSGDIGAGFEAVSYDVATGVVMGLGEDQATCVSGDGSVVGGEMLATGYGGYYDAGVWTDIGTLNTMGLSCGGGSVPKDLSADGTTLVGSDWGAGVSCDLQAYRWVGPAGPFDTLPKLGSGSARADVVSGDGLTIGGMERFAGSQNQAALWQWDTLLGDFAAPTLVTAGIDFGDGNLDGLGEVAALSIDGTAAAIHAGLNSAPHVKLWRSSGSVTDLGPIPGLPTARPQPTGITAGGTMIVGYAGGGGPFGPPPIGFVWTIAGGMQTADSFFAANGVPLPSGFASSAVSGCSSDGKTLWGTAGAFPFFSNWVITMPAWTKYSVGVGAANFAALTGSGSTSVTTGGPLNLVTSGLGTATAVIGAISLAPANFPLFGGALLVDPTSPNLQLPLLVGGAGGGSSSIPVGIPPTPSLVGKVVYCQTAAPSAAATAGWVLSNGLRVVICE